MKKIIATIISIAISLIIAVSYLSTKDGDSDPTCNYDDGDINAGGVATCTMDYSTKLHADQGKTIDLHCDNGFIVDAQITPSDSSCAGSKDYRETQEQNFYICADGDHTYCGWKWKNTCATNHHVTTKSISCVQ